MANIDFRKDSKQDIDNRSTPAELRARENESIPGYDRQNDGLDDYPISGGDASGKSGDPGDDATKNIDDVKDREENPMNSSYTGEKKGKHVMSFKSRMAKKGPLGALILGLGAGGIGIAGFLSPGLIFVQIADIFTNHNNVGNAAISMRTKAVLGNKIGNSFAEAGEAKCGVKCKFSTMDDDLVKRLKANKYDVISTKVGNRHIVTSIILPDKSETINNKADFNRVMENPTHAADFARVHNARSKPFMTTKFNAFMKKKLGITKLHQLVGTTKEKFNASFRKAIGLPEVRADTDPNRTQTNEERLNESPHLKKVAVSVGKLGGGLSGGIGAICTAHNVTRAINASVKIAKLSAYAGIAMVVLNAASKLKAADGAGIEPGVATQLGNMMTEPDTRATNADGTPNDGLGLTATNSYSYKAALYGDSGTPPNYVKQYSVEKSGDTGLFAVLGMITMFAANSPQARATANKVCGLANSDGASFVSCAPTGVTVIGYGLCVVTDIASGFVIGEIVKAALPKVIAAVVAGSLLNVDETARGPSLMEPIAAGSAAILNSSAQTYALTPGNKKQLTDYFKVSQKVNEADEAIARVQAKETPLDIYNQYSFLGSMAKSLNLAAYANAPLVSSAHTLASTIPLSFASLTTTTHAGTYMPVVEDKINQYKTGTCPSLEAIGALGDGSCMPSLTANIDELNAPIQPTLDYMTGAGGAVIDQTDTVRTDTEPGRQFQLYIDNCLNRIDEFGETSRALEDGEAGDYEWFLGVKCGENSEMVRHFRIYAREELINASVDNKDSALKTTEELNPTSTNSPLPTTPGENSGNIGADGWAFPTVAGAPLTQGYHDGHLALDIGSDPDDNNVPIYAMRDGVVTSVGDIPMPPYIKACNGQTGSTQQTVVIKHEVDGQVFFSTYHHVQPGKFPFAVDSTVKSGDRIATMGNTGCSFGQHLHVELWRGSIYGGGTTMDLGQILYG